MLLSGLSWIKAVRVIGVIRVTKDIRAIMDIRVIRIMRVIRVVKVHEYLRITVWQKNFPDMIRVVNLLASFISPSEIILKSDLIFTYSVNI